MSINGTDEALSETLIFSETHLMIITHRVNEKIEALS